MSLIRHGRQLLLLLSLLLSVFLFFGAFYLVLDRNHQKDTRNFVESILQAEATAFREGDYLSSLTKYQRVWLSSQLLRGMALCSRSEADHEKVKLDLGFGSLNPGLIDHCRDSRKAGEIELWRLGLFHYAADYRFPHRPDLVLLIETRNSSAIVLLASSMAFILLILAMLVAFVLKVEMHELRTRTEHLKRLLKALVMNRRPTDLTESGWIAIKEHWGSLQSELDGLNARMAKAEKDHIIAQTTAMIAHDLKQPLAIFERLAGSPVFKGTRDQEAMFNALKRLHAMADSIKRADLESIVRTNLVEIDFGEIFSQVQDYAVARGIHIIDPAGPPIKAAIDRDKLERALVNLLMNAIDAAQSWVKLDWLCSDTTLVLSVIDDGLGVSPLIERNLFQVGNTFGKTHGSGMGLAFAMQVAEGHGGSLVYVREGNVTCFKISLPDAFTTAFPEVELVKSSAGRISPKQTRDGRTMTLALWIDDCQKALDVAAKLQQFHPDIKVLTSRTSDKPDLIYTNTSQDVETYAGAGTHIIFAQNSDSVENVLALLQRRVRQPLPNTSHKITGILTDP